MLEARRQLIEDYFRLEKSIMDAREASQHRNIPQPNVCAPEYLRFIESLSKNLATKTIRGWHHTRLTSREIDDLQTTGIEISTMNFLKMRLDRCVASGDMTADVAGKVFAGSPLHSDQHDGRTGRFWLCSQPVEIDDLSAVELLLRYWGGEVAYFFLDDEDPTLQILSSIGTPRVIEVQVPLISTHHCYSLAVAITTNFANFLGVPERILVPDFCAVRHIPPQAIVAVHDLNF